MKLIELKCFYCGICFSLPRKEYTRQVKKGRDKNRFFCCLEHSGLCNNNSLKMKKISSDNLIKYNTDLLKSVKGKVKASLANECWKYEKIDKILKDKNINYKFEYPMIGNDKLYIYDLALIDKKIIIEFDEKHHNDTRQRKIDAIKNEIAITSGWEIKRIKVKSEVFEFSVIEKLL